jgi:hypothetical protein
VVLVSQGDNLFLLVGKQVLGFENSAIDFYVILCEQIFLDLYFWKPVKSLKEIDKLTEKDRKELNEINSQIEESIIKLNSKKEEQLKINQKIETITRAEKILDDQIEIQRARLEKLDFIIKENKLQKDLLVLKQNEKDELMKIKSELNEVLNLDKHKSDLDVLKLKLINIKTELSNFNKNLVIEEKKEDDLNECVACTYHYREIIFIECGHILYCRKCYILWKKKNSDNLKCSMCKEKIVNTIRAKYI